MKQVTLNTYKEDKYYPRVVRAFARILEKSDVVAPVEVLMEMGKGICFTLDRERLKLKN